MGSQAGLDLVANRAYPGQISDGSRVMHSGTSDTFGFSVVLDC